MQILNNTYFRYLTLVFAGFIGLFAFAPYNHSLLIGLSVLILFWVVNPLANNIKLSKSIRYAFIYGFSYFLTQVYWIFYSLYTIIHAGFWVAFVAAVGFSVFLAFYAASAIILYIRLKTKSVLFNSLFLFPSLWVMFEWLRGWVLGGYAWSDFGYTQVDNPLFRGYFKLWGEYGVSWLTVSIIGVVLVFLRYSYSIFTKSTTAQLQRDFRLAVVYTALIAILGSFIGPIQYTKPYGKPLSVELIQGNIPVGTKWTDESGLQVYYSAIDDAKADLVLIPETAISQFEMNLPDDYLDDLVDMAHDNGFDLVVGIPKIIDNDYNYVNAAMVLTEPSHPYYAKYHLVPYGEYIPAKWLLDGVYKMVKLPMVGFSPGKENQPPITVRNQKLAFNICYENAFARELTTAARDSTLMVNLSDMVWYGKTVAMNQHLQMSQARALENERYFIQVTNSSISAIINQDGEIQSQLPVFRRLVLKDIVQGRVGHTPFEIFNNWLIISWCSFIILGTILIHTLNRKRKT